MTSRDRMVLLVVMTAGVIAGFWFLALSPRREEASKLRGELVTAQARLDKARADAAAAAGARKRYDADYAAVARLGKAVPVAKGVPSLVYQLDSVAGENHIDFRTIQAGQAQAAPAVAPPAAQVAQAGAADKGTSQASGSAPAAPADPTQAATAGLPAGTPVGPANFPVMPFSFTFDGNFFNMEDFLRSVNRFVSVDGKRIRVSGRLLAVNELTLSEGPKGFPQMRASITANAFLLPPDQGLTAGATPQSPGASTTSPPAAAGSTGAAAPPAAIVPGVH